MSCFCTYCAGKEGIECENSSIKENYELHLLLRNGHTGYTQVSGRSTNRGRYAGIGRRIAGVMVMRLVVSTSHATIFQLSM